MAERQNPGKGMSHGHNRATFISSPEYRTNVRQGETKAGMREFRMRDAQEDWNYVNERQAPESRREIRDKQTEGVWRDDRDSETDRHMRDSRRPLQEDGSKVREKQTHEGQKVLGEAETNGEGRDSRDPVSQHMRGTEKESPKDLREVRKGQEQGDRRETWDTQADKERRDNRDTYRPRRGYRRGTKRGGPEVRHRRTRGRCGEDGDRQTNVEGRDDRETDGHMRGQWRGPQRGWREVRNRQTQEDNTEMEERQTQRDYGEDVDKHTNVKGRDDIETDRHIRGIRRQLQENERAVIETQLQEKCGEIRYRQTKEQWSDDRETDSLIKCVRRQSEEDRTEREQRQTQEDCREVVDKHTNVEGRDDRETDRHMRGSQRCGTKVRNRQTNKQVKTKDGAVSSQDEPKEQQEYQTQTAKTSDGESMDQARSNSVELSEKHTSKTTTNLNGEKMENQEKVGPEASDPDRPEQLISVTDKGHLVLNEDSFLWKDVSEHPVVLISVIGEKRKGKSFLMNYIMRALRSQMKNEELCLGESDETLVGFEWKPGTDSTTKGIWIWKRPFILEQKGKKFAVYVMDTEGSLDIETNKEINIKLSSLSMLLSSQLIFNVAGQLKATEADFLEMCLYMTKNSGEKLFQDILIRDWHDYKTCTEEDAEAYIRKEIKRLQDKNLYSNVLSALKDRRIHCSLLPHPGKHITGTGDGKLEDMDEDFRRCFRKYIEYVVKGAWNHIKTDIKGEVKAKDLLNNIKKSVEELNQVKYGISTPMAMYFALENQRHCESIFKEFDEFLNSLWAWRIPSLMPKHVSPKYGELREKFKQSLKGNTTYHKDLIDDFESQMRKTLEKFYQEYSWRFYRNSALTVGRVVGMAAVGAYGLAEQVAAQVAAPAASSEWTAIAFAQKVLQGWL